jgi:hypothetical protein
MNPWIVLLGVVVATVVYVLLPVALTTLSRYRRLRLLRCPETGEECRLRFDAARAALTSCLGRPRLVVQSCSLWPSRADCGRACAWLPEAELREGPEVTPASRPAGRRLADPIGRPGRVEG